MTTPCRITNCSQPASEDDHLGCCPQHTPKDHWNAPAMFDWLATNDIAELLPESPVFRIREGKLTYTAFEYDGPRDFNAEHIAFVDEDFPRIERTVPLLVAPTDDVKKAIVATGGMLITDDLDLHDLSDRLNVHERLKSKLRWHADPEYDTCPVWPCDIAHNLWHLLPDEYPDGPGGISAGIAAHRREVTA